MAATTRPETEATAIRVSKVARWKIVRSQADSLAVCLAGMRCLPVFLVSYGVSWLYKEPRII